MKKYMISAGTGYGRQRITSFDNALLDAGVGNFNLVRLSSILPLDAEKGNLDGIELGSLLPIAYAVESTNVPNREISAAVAIGFPVEKDEEHCAVIMEYEGECSKEKAIEIVTSMVAEGFEYRGWDLERIDIKASHAFGPEDGGYATAFACVAEWEE